MADEPNATAIDTAVDSASDNEGKIVLQNIDDIDSVINYTPTEGDDIVDTNLDFEKRYFSLDALNASDEGSDLAYVRILQFNNGKFGSQVFPLKTNGDKYKYKEFIVTSIDNNYMEKVQLLKTNNTLQIYSFDSQIEVLNIQGVLKSTMTDHWDMAMVMLWDEVLRATKLIQRKFIVEFGYESYVYWGIPISFRTQKSSTSQFVVSYAMQFVVVKRSIIYKQGNDFLSDILRQLNSEEIQGSL